MKDAIIKWIQDYFKENGPKSKAIVGISGGKDSSVVAALCVEALGKDRVLGVLMPQGKQNDILYAYDLCLLLGIKYIEINIGETVNILKNTIEKNVRFTEQANTNMPARIRMTTLYAVAQCVGGRVANTCNKSEDWVGYSTKFGDAAGDFSPLANFTVREVKAIGRELGLPEKFIEKVPADGLCGKTDEDNLGFTYNELDDYIMYGVLPSEEKLQKIERMHKRGLHKLQLMPSCPNEDEDEQPVQIILPGKAPIPLDGKHVNNVLWLGTNQNLFVDTLVKPNIKNQLRKIKNGISDGCSFVISDINKEIYDNYADMLKEAGYNIKILDLDDFTIIDTYNPFDYFSKDSVFDDISRFVDTLVNSTNSMLKEDASDKFWINCEKALLISVIAKIKLCNSAETQNMEGVHDMLRKLLDKDTRQETEEDLLCWKADADNDMITTYFATFKIGAKNAYELMIIRSLVRLQVFVIKDIYQTIKTSTINLNDFQNEKTALFILCNAVDRTFDFIGTLMIEQMLQEFKRNQGHIPVMMFLSNSQMITDIDNMHRILPSLKNICIMTKAAKATDVGNYMTLQAEFPHIINEASYK